MGLGLLLNVPIKVRFQEPGTATSQSAVDALVGQFIPGLPAGVLLQLDASLSENHQTDAVLTEHPMEEGADINDHYRVRPRRLSIEGTVTDSPVQYLSLSATGLGSITNIGNVGLSPRLNAHQTLQRLMFDKTVFDVVTGLDFYKGMMIVSLSEPCSAQIGRQLRFTAELQQAHIIKADETGVIADDLLASEEELGYLQNQIPDAVTIAASAVFLGLVGYQFLSAA